MPNTNCLEKMSNSNGISAVVPFAEPLWYTRNSSPFYNDSHRRLRDAVQTYVAEKITPNCAEWEAQGFVPKEVS